MAAQSRRQRLEAHRVEAVCAGCHSLMDPLGLAFEQYDGTGAMRSTDNGVPIDPSGNFAGLGKFSGPEELSNLIAQSPEYARCISEHAFIYGLGRAEREGNYDVAAIDAMTQTFVSKGSRFPDLIEALVTSDVFRQRQDEPLASSLPGGGGQ